MSKLFGRKCRIIVGTAPGSSTASQDALSVDSLRMQFKVKKDNSAKPNTAECVITNLKQSNRSRIQVKGAPVIIQAGYESTIATIFSGVVRTADAVWVGPDCNMVVRSGDGENAYGYATISQAFRKGTPKATVLAALCKALSGFAVDPVDTSQAQLIFANVGGVFANGYSAYGKVARHLDVVLKTIGFEWSIQDRALQVLNTGGTTQEQAVFLSPSTGLIGSPQHGSGDGKSPQKNAGVVKVKALLQPLVRPGSKISVQSNGLTGILRVISVEHQGDTHGDDWTSDIEAMPSPGSTAL